MAACDAKYRFTFVDMGAYGKEETFVTEHLQGPLPLLPCAPLTGSDVLTPPVFVADEAKDKSLAPLSRYMYVRVNVYVNMCN